MFRFAMYCMIGFGVAIGYSDKFAGQPQPEVLYAITVAAWPVLIAAEVTKGLRNAK